MVVVSESERKREREREIKESGAMSTGARTRGQKRRRGARDLWEVIVKCDDICFQHILPRLNGTDVKFLHGVNTETRKLIKRSSRAGDLKKKFQVEEMSSISTLEVAWEHYPWGSAKVRPKDGRNIFLLEKLLKRINSSCSSGRERRKSVSGIDGRFIRPQNKVIWKW